MITHCLPSKSTAPVTLIQVIKEMGLNPLIRVTRTQYRCNDCGICFWIIEEKNVF